VDVHALQVEVTWCGGPPLLQRPRRVATVLATEISAQEVAMAQDSATICVKDVMDQTTLAEREAWERVS
jgi:hypothetical protein